MASNIFFLLTIAWTLYHIRLEFCCKYERLGTKRWLYFHVSEYLPSQGNESSPSTKHPNRKLTSSEKKQKRDSFVSSNPDLCLDLSHCQLRWGKGQGHDKGTKVRNVLELQSTFALTPKANVDVGSIELKFADEVEALEWYEALAEVVHEVDPGGKGQGQVQNGTKGPKGQSLDVRQSPSLQDFDRERYIFNQRSLVAHTVKDEATSLAT